MQAIATHRGGTIEVLPKRRRSAVAFGLALAFAGWSTGLVAIATGLVLAAAERDRKSGQRVSASSKVIRALAVVGGFTCIVVVPLAMGVVGTFMIAGLLIVPIVVQTERELGVGAPADVRAARRAFYFAGFAVSVLVMIATMALAIVLFLR